jgi:hypothetical protein
LLGKNFLKNLIVIISITLITSCSPKTTTVSRTTETLRPKITKTSEPTLDPTPTSTATKTPEPTFTISGTIFFDYNGSGLQDIAHDMNGNEREEPGIANAHLCLNHNPNIFGVDDESCVLTSKDGSYSFVDIEEGTHRLFVVSPYDEPEEAFRYINIWKGPVIIEAYEMNGVQVPEQHLNDTEVMPIDDALIVRVDGIDVENNIGLMQGFLTLPFRDKEINDYWLSNYVDLDINPGMVRNYEGNEVMVYDPSQYRDIEGTGDQHNGLDFEGAEGLFVVSAAPSSRVYALVGEPIQRANTVGMLHMGTDYASSLGHLDQWVVRQDQQLFRGQIIGTNGSTGTSHPHIHFSFMINIEPNNVYVDPFRDLIQSDSDIKTDMNGQRIYIGSPGFWTKASFPFAP